MKLSSLPILFILGVFAVGCGSTSSRGSTGSGGQAGAPASAGSGGAASGGSGGPPGNSGSGGMPATSGSGGAGATGGSHASGGVSGGGHGGSAAGGTAGAGGCPGGQIWCPGCTAGSGRCSAVGCPAAQCPVQDAGMSDAPGGCSMATTDSDCSARGGCHSVFADDQTCDCAPLGCCTRFSRCADGPALCTSPAIACTLQVPHCEGAYVVSYAGGCYEGCVRSTDCPAGAGGAGGSAAGGHGGGTGGGGAGGATAMSCSSAPPVACPTGQICDNDQPNRCGAGYEGGHCIVMPDGCTADYAPVCGCDNKTYSNDCERQRAREQLSHTGACT